MAADTATPAGVFMLTVFAGIAQFERQRMLERRRAGIERAKAEGKFKGRPVSFDPAEIRELRTLRTITESRRAGRATE